METEQSFETKTCSRCGGTGKHSFNLRDLDRCYGCGGTGVKYTARGLLAATRYDELRSLPVSELTAGMQIQDRGRWHTLEAIEPSSCRLSINGVEQPRGVDLVCKALRICGAQPETTVRVRQTPEQAAAKKAEALAYQATLTKSGAIRKGVKR